MMIVEQGKIVEVCAEPGEFKYDASTEPSIFAGSLGDSIAETFNTVGRRFTFGGDTGKDQRVYYFNTKELVDNKFGTPNPIPFRVVDSRIGLDVDVSIRCSGLYSYKIADPLLFYTNVCGNVERDYRRGDLESQLKTEFISALEELEHEKGIDKALLLDAARIWKAFRFGAAPESDRFSQYAAGGGDERRPVG